LARKDQVACKVILFCAVLFLFAGPFRGDRWQVFVGDRAVWDSGTMQQEVGEFDPCAVTVYPPEDRYLVVPSYCEGRERHLVPTTGRVMSAGEFALVGVMLVLGVWLMVRPFVGRSSLPRADDATSPGGWPRGWRHSAVAGVLLVAVAGLLVPVFVEDPEDLCGDQRVWVRGACLAV
jgi:hypothetical protein